ncbi:MULTISPECIES: ATP-binding protein [unclassified Amycolatopsis]|uniref:sensor histidine kinase n=1 Tax=unclassified Amycolatopsis TaxID=2618356 RepID=UPI0028764452|nr:MULTISPECIES: ATP-binding protein [unclassified Amycolatopsis]MDS0134840.1 sensor histidine kinase [Amycolatopsis sp. 505]MDS0147984.1 sensor histidine kinase [Amycolatopsis sp. CM201R]
MASRARELLDRSRVLLDRSRVAAAQFLTAPPKHPGSAPPAGPAFVELTRPEPVAEPSGEGVLAEICASVALRDLNLLDQLLARLEELEAGEEDHHRLAELYQLDHLATRLRRNAENLRVLAGQDTAGDAARATSVLDLMREAMSSINHYARITIGRVVNLGVVGFAAEDLGRVLAELFDNAANQSSPSSPVHVSAHLTEQGSVLVRIEDEGIGIPADRIGDLNARLAAGGDLDDASARHMGLAVVARLAARHGVTVRLDRRSPHGTVATVLLPTGVVTELAENAWSGTRTVTVEPVKTGAGPEPATVGGLPRRRAGTFPRESPEPLTARKPSPRPRPVEGTTGGITANGLPRRVPGSIRGAAPEPPPPPPPPAEDAAGHERLLADLGAFADGEQAALAENRTRQDETPGGTAR